MRAGCCSSSPALPLLACAPLGMAPNPPPVGAIPAGTSPPEPPTTTEPSSLPLSYWHCKTRCWGRSSTDLSSVLAIALRFPVSPGFAEGMALPEEQGRGGAGRSWFSALFWRLQPPAPPPSSCHPSWHAPPSPVRSRLARDLSWIDLQSAAHACAWQRRELLCELSGERNALVGLRVLPGWALPGDKLPGGWMHGTVLAMHGAGMRHWMCPEAGTGQRRSLHPPSAPVRTSLPLRA